MLPIEKTQRKTISLSVFCSYLSVVGCCGHTEDVKQKKRKARSDSKVVSVDSEPLSCGMQAHSSCLGHGITFHLLGILVQRYRDGAAFACFLLYCGPLTALE